MYVAIVDFFLKFLIKKSNRYSIYECFYNHNSALKYIKNTLLDKEYITIKI